MHRGPPLPIPNREVKPYSADDTAIRWESKSLPVFLNPEVFLLQGFFLSINTIFNFIKFNHYRKFCVGLKKNQISSMLQYLGQRIFILLFVSLLCNNLFSQDSIQTTIDSINTRIDSINPILDSSKVYFFYNDFEKQGPDFLSYIDTVITGIQRYDPVKRPGNYFATLGNIGSAHSNMIYTPYLKSGFDYGLHSFDKFMFHNDSTHHYWVGKPYTQVYYIMGSKKEQNLHIDHSQNVSSNFNVGLDFRYIHSPGFYDNQRTDDKNFVFKTRYQTLDYRYMVLANYIHNKLNLQENGGIVYDTVFEDNTEPSRNNIATNLLTANNTIKENTYSIKQLYKLSKRHRFRLPITNDSIAVPAHKKISLGNISLSTVYSRITHLYSQSLNENPGFYLYTYDSVNPTYDSTFINKLENEFSWTNADNAKHQLLTFNFALKYIYAETSIDSIKRFYSQLIPTGEMALSISERLQLDFHADMVTGNTYVGNYNLSGKLTFFSKFGNLEYKITNALQDVGRFYIFYSSNHFRWDNEFRKQSYLSNAVTYSYKNLQTGFNITNIGSFVYFDTMGYPSQLEEGNGLSILNIHLRKLFKLGNWSIDGRVIYQKASKTEAIRVPEFIGDLSVYYTKDLFKQAAILQTGFDAVYNTSYYAYAYMPATRSFHIQNNKEVGNYIYADIFLNLQIKRARLFLKYINVGSLFQDYSYFTTPSYPMKDSGFRFGISWMFYD